jgi:aminomethyltransferase
VHAKHAQIEEQTSTPDELGFGWMVKPERGPFLGREALRAAARAAPRWALVGLVLDWDEFEALHTELGLPPQPPCGAWRASVPVYVEGRQVGYATSGAWSPILKQNLALATVQAEHSAVGAELRMEVTVLHRRRTVTARVTPRPFFDPPRKTSVPRAAVQESRS